MAIGELKPGMKRVDVKGKVLSIGEPRNVTTRAGDESRVAEAVISDDSGTVKLVLWNDQIDQVGENNTVVIKNGYVTSFRGEVQLNVGRYGTLTVE